MFLVQTHDRETDVWKLQDALKKAVVGKKYSEAAKLQADLKSLQGPRYHPNEQDKKRLKSAEQMKEQLKVPPIP